MNDAGNVKSICMDAGEIERSLTRIAHQILEANKGQTDVHITLSQPGRQTVMRLDRSIRVDPNPSLYGDLKALLGSRCLSV